MREIKAYKSNSGRIYEDINDCLEADKELEDRLNFDVNVSKQNYPENYGTSYHNWKCNKSPVKRCVYDYDSDLLDDDCIYCHYPDERK